jgi:hypothetical protein
MEEVTIRKIDGQALNKGNPERATPAAAELAALPKRKAPPGDREEL